MVTPSSFIPVLKYGFLTLVVSCAGYLIASITAFKHIDGESIAEMLVRHQISMQTEGVRGVLDKGFERCLIHPSNIFCLMTAHKHFGQHIHLEDISENVTTPEPEAERRIHPIFKALRSFNKLARNLNITSVLLDPSLLFCLLNPTSKTLLLKNGFNPARFQGPKNSVIMGVDEDGARILSGSMRRILRGFKRWSKVSRDSHFLPDRLPGKNVPVQFTFQKASVVLYVSVIYRRNEYLWRSNMEDANDLPVINYDSAFENFTVVRIPTELNMDLYVPSDPVHFLFQMENSPFHVCNLNASDEVQSHPTLTRDQLENRAAVALQELKAVFRPYFVRFWLWGGTRSGLFKNCNIFATVTDLNIAALNSDLEKVNVTEIFSGNEYLTLIPEFSVVDNKLSKISFDCHGLKINLFVAHENGENIDYYEDAGTGWRTYIKSEMSSTDVFGQIVYCPHFARVNSLTKPSTSS